VKRPWAGDVRSKSIKTELYEIVPFTWNEYRQDRLALSSAPDIGAGRF
jgi:hypothetical protein